MLHYTYFVSLVTHKIRKIGLIFSSNVNDDKIPSLAQKCKTGSVSKPNSIYLDYCTENVGYSSVFLTYERGWF